MKYFLSVCIFLLFTSSLLWAEEQSHSKSIKCPAVIADRDSGVFYTGRDFRCFDNKRSAKNKGFISAESLVVPDFTGWWRLGVTQVQDTCSTAPFETLGKTSIFLQVKHTDSGLFVGLCPGKEKYVGNINSSKNGFLVSSSTTTLNDPDCNGGEADIRYYVEVSKVDAFITTAGSVRYSKIKSCKDITAGSFHCSTVYEGTGGRETPDHRFWPEVPENINEFNASCDWAQTKCAECHG